MFLFHIYSLMQKPIYSTSRGYRVPSPYSVHECNTRNKHMQWFYIICLGWRKGSLLCHYRALLWPNPKRSSVQARELHIRIWLLLVTTDATMFKWQSGRARENIHNHGSIKGQLATDYHWSVSIKGIGIGERVVCKGGRYAFRQISRVHKALH